MPTTSRGLAITAVGNAVPLVLLFVTQALLAHGLSVDGRGIVAAATAPLMFAAGLLTLGLPESLTHLAARGIGSGLARQFVGSAIVLTMTGLIGSWLIVKSAPILSNGSQSLAELMTLASIALAPALVTVAFRAIAYGARRWWLVSVERIFSASLQLLVVCGLYLTEALTPMTATVAIAVTSFAGTLIYVGSPRWWRSLSHPRSQAGPAHTLSSTASYAGRIWVGSIAGIVLTKLDQLMMTPLAGVDELGIYVVAVNVSSLALQFNMVVGQVLFAVESDQPSLGRIARAARITTLVTAMAASVLAATSPWIVPRAFGADFAPAVPVVYVLLVAYSLAVPGSVAGVALSARGHPGLRSLSMLLATISYVFVMILLVPNYGALGAAFAMFVATVLPGYINIFLLYRHCGARLSDFYRFTTSDLRSLNLRALIRRPSGPSRK